MEKKKSHAICVFCGSSYGHDPRFRDAARAGGAGVAKAAQDGGAPVQGIIPAFLQALEPPISEEEKLIVTPHIQERKALMLKMADAFVVLPGGLGTFDEFFEVSTEAQLGVHKKPIVAVNVGGYFDALDTMLRAIVEHGFARDIIFDLYHLAEGPDAALKILEGRLDGGSWVDGF